MATTKTNAQDDGSDTGEIEHVRDRAGLDAEPPEFNKTFPFEALDRYSTKSMDRPANAHLARFTLGVSSYGLASTFFTWGVHLIGAPGKQMQLIEKVARKVARLAVYAGTAARNPDCQPCIAPLAHDRRFDDASWQHWPNNLIYQSFLLTQQWWYNAARDIDGVSAREEQVVSFVTRQMLDLMSPSNFIATNPEVRAETLRRGGANLRHGWQNFLEDWERAVSGKLPVGTENYRYRARCGSDARQGGVPQPTVGTDPIRADNADGKGRADPDHPGVDHEILYP